MVALPSSAALPDVTALSPASLPPLEITPLEISGLELDRKASQQTVCDGALGLLVPQGISPTANCTTTCRQCIGHAFCSPCNYKAVKAEVADAAVSPSSTSQTCTTSCSVPEYRTLIAVAPSDCPPNVDYSTPNCDSCELTYGARPPASSPARPSPVEHAHSGATVPPCRRRLRGRPWSVRHRQFPQQLRCHKSCPQSDPL